MNSLEESKRTLEIQKGFLEGTNELGILSIVKTLQGSAGAIPVYPVVSPVGESYIALSHLRNNKGNTLFTVGDTVIKADNNHLFILKSVTLANGDVAYLWAVKKTK